MCSTFIMVPLLKTISFQKYSTACLWLNEIITLFFLQVKNHAALAALCQIGNLTEADIGELKMYFRMEDKNKGTLSKYILPRESNLFFR